MKKLLYGFIRKVAKRLGFVIYRKGAFRTTMHEILASIRQSGFEPNTLIDVGVAYGTDSLYKAFPDAEILLIEPLEEYLGVMKSISAKYRAQYCLAAANRTRGTVTLNVCPGLPGSSVYQGAQDKAFGVVARDVPATTIDFECAARKLSGPFLIKLDVQGAEIEVLKGARKVLNETEVVILEASLYEFSQGVPLIDEVIFFMKSQGYVVYDLFDLKLRPLDGALFQVDLAFVKEKGRFRKQHIFSTISQFQQMLHSADPQNVIGG